MASHWSQGCLLNFTGITWVALVGRVVYGIVMVAVLKRIDRLKRATAHVKNRRTVCARGAFLGNSFFLRILGIFNPTSDESINIPKRFSRVSSFLALRTHQIESRL